MNELFGMSVTVSPLAVSKKLVVVRNPIKKRRRNWRLQWKEMPCAYVIGQSRLVVHAEIYKQLLTVSTLPKGQP